MRSRSNAELYPPKKEGAKKQGQRQSRKSLRKKQTSPLFLFCFNPKV